MRQKKIIMTGGSGRFAQVFKKIKKNVKIYYPSKNLLNIEKPETIKNILKKLNLITLSIVLLYLGL